MIDLKHRSSSLDIHFNPSISTHLPDKKPHPHQHSTLLKPTVPLRLELSIHAPLHAPRPVARTETRLPRRFLGIAKDRVSAEPRRREDGHVAGTEGRSCRRPFASRSSRRRRGCSFGGEFDRRAALSGPVRCWSRPTWDSLDRRVGRRCFCCVCRS